MALRKNRVTQSLHVYSDMVVFGGISIRTKPHAHHALKIILSKELPITVIHEDQQYTSRGLILRSDITHETLAHGPAMFLYLETESIIGRQFSIHLKEANVISIGDEIVLSLIAFFEGAVNSNCSETEIKKYLLTKFFIYDIDYSFKPTIDERVSRTISYIHQNLKHITTTKELTGISCLSESRLLHLFKKEVGVPIRKYILWCRIRHAIQLVLEGNSLTQSAKLSGFSDGSHLNRTFVFFFGMSPSDVFKTTS